MKKYFILHVDSLDILDELTDEQAGQLFKAIKNHHKEQENNLEPLIKMAFIPFKNQFLRDEDKYEQFIEKQSINGSKGGRPKGAKKPKKPKPLNKNPKNPSEPKKAYNVSDSINDNDSENEKQMKTFELFRKEYRGLKRGFEEEFSCFKKHNNWEVELPKLLPALKLQNEHKDKLIKLKKFTPEYKNLSTWLNQRCWTVEIPKIEHQDIPETTISIEEYNKWWDKRQTFKQLGHPKDDATLEKYKLGKYDDGKIYERKKE